MEDKIYSVLEKYGIDEPKASAITEDLLFLCAVSQQRELLIEAFDLINIHDGDREKITKLVDITLKSINCG
jgi:hypothetical protein